VLLHFFLAIRVFRLIYSKIFDSVGENNYINLKKDAQLSMAIGGAAACFVATDPLLPGNFLKVPFGVTPEMTPLGAMTTAGSSTAVGYFALQATENLVPSGRNWLDPDFK